MTTNKTHDPELRAAIIAEINRAKAEGAQAVRAQLAQPGAAECEDCGDEIPEARRIAAPWAVRCVYCQELSGR